MTEFLSAPEWGMPVPAVHVTSNFIKMITEVFICLLQEEAQKKYTEAVNDLLKEDAANSAGDGEETASAGGYKEIIYEEVDKVTYITLNRWADESWNYLFFSRPIKLNYEMK